MSPIVSVFWKLNVFELFSFFVSMSHLAKNPEAVLFFFGKKVFQNFPPTKLLIVLSLTAAETRKRETLFEVDDNQCS